MKTTATLSILACLAGLNSLAEQRIDITLADNGNNQLEVRLRPTGPFNDVVSGVVFTLRWQETFGPALSLFEPTWPQSEFLPLSSSPVVSPGNGYMYRTYSAVGLVPMHELDQAWEGGMEYPICVMNILTPGVQVTLCNDSYTAVSNRDFYVSLNGSNKTGIIYESPVPAVSAKAITAGDGYIDVLLSPEADYFGWVNAIDFTLRWPANSASLGSIVQDEAYTEALPIAKVGPEVTVNGYAYQRFHGAGTLSLARAQLGWLANEDHVVARLPIIGANVDATVADDAWTAANNGEYSILLNGAQSAGGTDEISTGTGPAFQELIPAMQVVGDELQVRTSPDGSGTLALTVLNAAGQHLSTAPAQWGATQRISLAAWPTGVYILNVRTDTGMVARRFQR
jgi:hypothetical protein